MADNQYVHVAVIQMTPSTGDRRANVARATNLARSAARDHGAEVIVFPECTLTGYTPAPPDEQRLARDRELAETVPGESTGAGNSTISEVGDPQFGRVPRHVRVHPLNPGDL